ncbi:adenylyltransferase/cytidyltransferase family protein [Pseudomonas protegens]|uniref:adenylyltransferase/cytidyltransferase family protein n=1 Tax=Pseudomonas protegens TaxID=380021 RepID=UPI000CD2BF41|nr:adenylyltransferase/cytidyltransferase family protein [Pseudomonas protegens]POA83612.1 cytidyltransferase [Pseudomonas protegens]
MFELALYGGAFNPPHAGHAQVMLEAARYARRVLVVPSFRHPDGKRMADFEQRASWLQAITAHLQPECDAELAVSRLERQLALADPGPVYSFTLLQRLADDLALDGKRIALVVGEDVARQLPRFHRGEELLQRFSILCIEEQPGVRSSVLRQCLARGETPPRQWLAPGMNPLNYGLYAVHGS